MGQAGAPVGLQAHRSSVFKDAPWSGQMRTPARGGSTAPEGQQRRETRLSRLLPEGTVPPVRGARPPDHGVRERLSATAGCHASSRERRDRSAANKGSQNLKRRFDLDCVADSDGALGSRDCGQSSVSQLKLSVVQAKELIADDRARCMRSHRQRFPTVRMADRIGNSEV